MAPTGTYLALSNPKTAAAVAVAVAAAEGGAQDDDDDDDDPSLFGLGVALLRFE